MVGKPGFSFARMLLSKGNGSKERQFFFFFYNHNSLRSSAGYSYSTTAKVAAEMAGDRTADHFLVNYLTDSLNFSRDDAISAAAKVSQFKSQTKPAIVVKYLQQIGMEPTHIRAAVSRFPKLLFSDPEKTLNPKIQCLQELGMSGPNLVSFITRDASFLSRGLETHLRPALHFLKEAAGSNHNALKALKRSGWLLSYGSYKTMEENVQVLRNLGFPDEKIQQFVMARPSYLTNKSGWIVKILNRVEKEFGIPRSAPMFYSGVFVATALSKSTVDRKLEILRSFGWSNSEISTMVQKQPHSLTVSEDRLKRVLNFLMKELGYSSHYLAFRPMFLMSSLEKKTIPRSQVLKILKENQLRACSLFTAISLTESKFSNDYLLPHKDKLPEMYQRYITSMEM
nr:transcription termination factor MTERF5, chloroplastic-like [Ipomoea batatas]